MKGFRIGVVTLFCASAATAQTPAAAAKKSFAVIEGTAVDSLHRDFLRGALLTVEGSTAGAISDSLGRFRIDSILPGTRRVEVSHPLLDSLGIALLTPPLKLDSGQLLHLVVAVPSIPTVLAARCTPGERQVGPGALLGTVQYAESELPAESAQVVLEFIEIRISGKGIQTVPYRRVATVSANGHFKICGLPDDLSGSVIAANGPDTTGQVGVHLSAPIGVIGLELPDPLPKVSTSPGATGPTVIGRKGNAVLTGLILDPSGAPLPRARVSVAGDTAATLSDTEGKFILRNLRSGTHSIYVRRLGFQPAEVAVTLHSRSPTEVTVKLGQFVALLDTVMISSARVRALDRVGFTRRKQIGTGYYMTPDEISKRANEDLVSLLSSAPMLRRANDGGKTVVAGRSRGFDFECVSYFVDGDPWIGGGIEDFFRSDDISAIEVYSSSFTPLQFRRGTQDCETVVIWTKARVR
jgi:hypothetical protein